MPIGGAWDCFGIERIWACREDRQIELWLDLELREMETATMKVEWKFILGYGFLLLIGSLSILAEQQTQMLRWGPALLNKPSSWFATEQAGEAADAVLTYQSEHGAWPKNWNLLEPATHAVLEHLESKGYCNTIDNGATVLPMRFLAKVHEATTAPRDAEAFERGLVYLLKSQYQNGGFPQFFPLRGDRYYSQITYNDNAMIRVLELLKSVAEREAPYDFVDEVLRVSVEEALNRGIDCILNTQIWQDGQLTAWCAQHDRETLEPAWARAYEPPSVSGAESVGIVRFLMSLEEPSPQVIEAVQSAVEWLHTVAIHGKRLEKVRQPDGRLERVLVSDPEAPMLWARFYELETNRPIFLDRDSVVRYDYAEIGYERRSGYSFFGTWAKNLLAKEYPRWASAHGLMD